MVKMGPTKWESPTQEKKCKKRTRGLFNYYCFYRRLRYKKDVLRPENLGAVKNIDTSPTARVIDLLTDFYSRHKIHTLVKGANMSEFKTKLYNEHVKLKAKIVPFGGWMMPVSYSSVLAEHKAVREECGLFDVSHMGEVFITGKDSLDFIQKITINDASKLAIGGGQYTAMCLESGGMIDDLILYRLEEEKYLMCVNASNVEKDYAWIEKQAASFKNLSVENASSSWSQLALQGPKSLSVLKEVLSDEAYETASKLSYTHVAPVVVEGSDVLLARTGYTGEVGYELYIPNKSIVAVWRALLATKEKTGILPIGLGARDTLRLEACYLLYGNDMNEKVSPLEAGIAWATKIDAKDFIGKEALIAQKESGLQNKIYAFKLEDKGIPRHGMDIYFADEKIGTVTSGSVLPTVGGAGGLAFLKTNKVKLDDAIEIDIRGKRKLARIVKRPLYSAKVKN